MSNSRGQLRLNKRKGFGASWHAKGASNKKLIGKSMVSKGYLVSFIMQF